MLPRSDCCRRACRVAPQRSIALVSTDGSPRDIRREAHAIACVAHAITCTTPLRTPTAPRRHQAARRVRLQGAEEGSNEERTRTSITNSLKTKLADLMRDFSALRNSITSHYRDVVDRRYEIVTGEKAGEEQLDQLIETGEAENLFQKAILSQGRGKVRWDVLRRGVLLMCSAGCLGATAVRRAAAGHAERNQRAA